MELKRNQVIQIGRLSDNRTLYRYNSEKLIFNTFTNFKSVERLKNGYVNSAA